MKKKSFVADYQKVMAHLEKENFALSDFVLSDFHFQEGELLIEIPKRFSISEQPDETIRSLRRLYAIGKDECVKEIKFDY